MVSLEEIGKNLPALLASLFISLLFLQSGFDKVTDWRGNYEWLTGHFSKTFLKNFVWIALAKLTVLEVATGIGNIAGIVYFLATGSTIVIFWAALLGALTVTGLFFGQRIAKDYPGAAVLVPYFIVHIILIWLTNPYTAVVR